MATVESENPELDEQVEKLLELRRRQSAKFINTALRFGISIYCVQVVAQIAHGQVANKAHAFAYGISLLLNTIAALCTKVFVSGQAYGFLHVFVMAMFCVVALTEDASQWSPLYLAMHSCGSLVVGGMLLRFHVLALTNTMLLGCYMVAHFRSESSAGDKVLSRTVGAELFIYCGNLVVLYAAEALLRFGARQEAVAKFGKCHLSAVSSLLDMMCDAVLELDEDMHFKSHFTKFANMLMHGTGRPLKGIALSSFIGNSFDREALEETLRKGREGVNSMPSMLSLRLRDAIGNSVRVALYQVPYTSVSGAIHHIIGLREESRADDQFPQGVLRSEIAQELGPGPSASSALALPPPVSIGRRTHSTSSNGSRRSRSSCAYIGEWEAPEWNMSVRVALDDRFSVKWMGEEICQKLGVDKDAKLDLADFIADGGRALRSWIDTNMAWSIAHSVDAQFTLRFDSLTLAGGGNGRALVTGMVFAKFTPPFRSGETPDEVILGWSRGRAAPAPARNGTAASSVPQSLTPACPPPAPHSKFFVAL